MCISNHYSEHLKHLKATVFRYQLSGVHACIHREGGRGREWELGRGSYYCPDCSQSLWLSSCLSSWDYTCMVLYTNSFQVQFSVNFWLRTPVSMIKSCSLVYQTNLPKNENVNDLSLCTSRVWHVNLMHSEAGEDDIHKHNRTCSNTKICLYRINIVALKGLHFHQVDQSSSHICLLLWLVVQLIVISTSYLFSPKLRP